MSTDAAKPPPQQANVSIESVLDISNTVFGSASRVRSVLGDGRAHHHLHRDELVAACVIRHHRQLLQHHAQFLVIGIMALGMTAVIATGGIDLSVGSIMGPDPPSHAASCSKPAIPPGQP